ncbi:MAG: TolC family protein, partial [Paludibacteraceae bacterium]|nr:TolC family protein [Paludibacteraceae bacterium]
QLCNNLQNAYAIFLNEKENLEVTNRVMKNVLNKYSWGSASLLELTNAGNDVISAQSTYVQASLTLIQNFVELEKFLHNEK